MYRRFPAGTRPFSAGGPGLRRTSQRLRGDGNAATQILPWPLVERAPDEHFPAHPLQDLLRARGYNLAADGIFGPTTEGAVKDFQEFKGLPVDGIVGPLTWKKLIAQVEKGSTGDAVRGVQEVMRFHDQSDGEGAPIHVDGIFGPQTDHWVEVSRTPSGSTRTESSARSRGERWSAGCCPAKPRKSHQIRTFSLPD